MLVSEIIDSAMRKNGSVASGEEPTDDEYTDCLEALQVMLRSWAAEKINVFSSVAETHTLVSGTASYTWGSGGDIDTVRPNQVIGVSIDSAEGITNPVEIIGEGRYKDITSKTTGGRPYALFPKYAYPLVTIYLYPVPDAAETLNLYSMKPFTETSSFTATTDTIQMPVHYQEPIIYNLAVRIAPEFGKTVTREVAVMADSSYQRLITLNAANYVEPISIDLPAGAGGYYSINSDSYR